MLRPFFGQCIFNIIFAAPAYPVSLLLSASSASLPFPLSCCGRNFFRFFIFLVASFFLPYYPSYPPTRSNLVCNGRVCIFSTYAACRVLGVGRRPLATVRFAGGLAAYAKCSQRFCIFIYPFPLLCLSHPSPSSLYCFFFLYSLLGVEVKRTLRGGWTGLGS